MSAIPARAVFPVKDYDLGATLNSGQAFRWEPNGQGWSGVIGDEWVRLSAEVGCIVAEAAVPTPDWADVANYLQVDVDLQRILSTFPEDEPIRQAVRACRGLRLLKQDPWECLGSFILSSTKQIVQIRQIIAVLCTQYGKPVQVPERHRPAFAFPEPAALAGASERGLRDCKMGFRAPYLLDAARAVHSGQVNLKSLSSLSCEAARGALMELPGVGRKIADCVLLFAYGFQEAFPVDVWVLKALRELYFPGQRRNVRQLQDFAAKHFGPYAGYAQQYLFHYMRTRGTPQPDLAKLTKL